ncbi:Ribulose-5-phosphate 4-epimerase/Fuculose-1-phosphate aldolase [Chromohalobacter canadensis]|uniref:Ribulose-5-phosphate 4-epimerase/Fuculose-1-phosphate aldolase n=1 Tax=Chromohalobacter canadensis TaxID=141389 RepID=A0A285VVT3_9GAMM|nr:class II aldolase and adducin N-terminal domain-containing protein [Chromohalobacter canadensis]SOC58155.1 Ribulose-5-phosphate 4-epimerase/Fuculose-1-phosphate aldolase [Chromohalobacter canadensis]
MTTATELPGTPREQLACAFRWLARLDMHEGVANHCSLATQADGRRFLVNPEGRHFAEMRASDLVEVDASAAQRPESIDPTAWAIHGAMHRQGRGVGCVMHAHSLYATALACLETPELPPVEQNAMRFFERVHVDAGFDGMGLDEEAERLGQLAGTAPILLLGNHGLVATGHDVAEAFDNLYYFERACRSYLVARASGLPVRPVAPEVARKTAQQWEDYLTQGSAHMHLAALMRLLDRDAPDYRD